MTVDAKTTSGAEGHFRSAPAVLRRSVLGVGVTSIGQLVVGIASGVQAILIAALFGVTAGTDGFFAAYGVYSLVVLLAQSWRVTLVARLVESESRFAAFNRFLGAGLLLFLFCGIFFVALGGPLSSLLTGSLPAAAHNAARETLLILWPAMGLQLLSALVAAMLGVLGDYTRAALSYALGSVVSIAAFAALEPAFGITALPLGILVGMVVNVVPMVHGLLKAGWRPAGALAFRLGESVRAAVVAVVASLTNVFVYLVFVVSITVATRLGQGEATIYTYAYFVVGLVTTLIGSSVMIVLAAPLATLWDRRPASLRPYTDDVFRTGLLVVAPVVAGAALLGVDLGSVAFPHFTDAELHSLIVVFLVLSASMITTVASTVPSLALFTQGRYRTTAVIALVALVVQATLSLGALALDSLAALAVTSVVSSGVRLVGTLGVLHGRDLPQVLGRLGAQLLQVLVPAAACFAAPALILDGSGALGHAAAWALGMILYVAVLATTMPTHRMLALRLIQSLRRAEQAAA